MRRLWIVVVSLVAALSLSADCRFASVLEESFAKLKYENPRVLGQASYSQTLHFKDGEWKTPVQRDYALREIPLAVLDPVSCEVEVVRVVRTISGGRLSEPKNDCGIRLAERAFGAIWNDFNTQFYASGKLVVLSKWRRFNSEDYIYYSPYSEDLDLYFDSLREAGSTHFENDLSEALTELGKRGLVQDTTELRRLLKVVFVSENTDPYEFKASDHSTKKRITGQPFVTLGANGDKGYIHKVSHMGARGPMQVWGPTCSDLKRIFKSAELARDCNGASWGSHSHIGNIAAAALEFEWHRSILEGALKNKIPRNADFERMRLASYNGGPGWVIKARKNHGADWDKFHTYMEGKGKKRVRKVDPSSLRSETVDYLKKCDFLLENKVEIAELSGAK